MMKASLVVLVRSECSGWVVGFLFSKLISCEMDVVGNSWRRGLAGRCFGVDFNQITGKPCKVRPCERRQLISCALLSFLSAQLVFLNSSLKFQGSGGIKYDPGRQSMYVSRISRKLGKHKNRTP